MPRARLVLILTALAALTTVCGAASASARAPVWLCRPGQAHDICTPGLATTIYTPELHRVRVIHPRAEKAPPIDCFYVYPTVSAQQTGNANLHIDPEERSIALYQAARYSQYCRVYAPMYRQVTIAGLGTVAKPTTPPNLAMAFGDVRAAFAYYLRHFNHGRGFVLLGHSQGSFFLRLLIQKDIDRKPAVRRRLVSAILPGGDVLVKPGRRGIGGDFMHVPACRSSTQLGCVIAYSTYDQPVPSNSVFGRARPSQFGNPAAPGDIVLCTNPAALGGGAGLLDFVSPSAPFAPGVLSVGIAILGVKQPHPPTTWFELPNAFSARCVDSNGAHVLGVEPVYGGQTPNPSPTPAWGLHLLDASIALGNLVRIVHSESLAYTRRHP